LAPAGLKSVDDWLADYRRLWAERLDRLDDYLSALQAKPGKAAQAAVSKPFRSTKG